MKKETGKDTNLKKIVIIVSVLLVLSISSLAAIGLKSGKAKEVVEAVMNPTVETTVPMNEFLVNLTPKNNTRTSFLKIELSLYSLNKDAEMVLTEATPKIRDAVISVLQTQAPETIFDKEESGSLAVKNKLLQKVNQVLEEPIVKDIYITNLVVQ